MSSKLIKFLTKYKLPLLTLLVIGITLPFTLSYFIPKTETDTEEVVNVTRGNVSVAFSVQGNSVLETRELSFELAGIVRGVSVQEGDEVKPWQTLAYLDTREAQKNLELKMRDYLSTRNDFDEMGQVTYQEQINDSVVDDTIRRILEKNQWDLEQAVLDVELKDLVLKKSYLSSPIAGVVASITYQPGELAATSKSAITIVNKDSLVVESYLEDIEALKVIPDMQVRVVFEALPDQEFLGHISYLSSLATMDENDLALYHTLITLDPHDQTILDGMACDVEVISKEVEGVLKLPNSAIKRVDSNSVVYQRDEQGELVTIPVELGFTNGKEVELKSGLELGDAVINWK